MPGKRAAIALGSAGGLFFAAERVGRADVVAFLAARREVDSVFGRALAAAPADASATFGVANGRFFFCLCVRDVFAAAADGAAETFVPGRGILIRGTLIF
jgi:hypothetical protein